MFPLRGKTSIFGLDGPAVTHFANFALSGINHRLDGKNHAWGEFFQSAWATVMQNLRLFVEHLANAMAAKFTDYAVAGLFCMLLDHETNIAQVCTRFDFRNAEPHAFERDFSQSLGKDGRFADKKHAAGIAMITIFDDGNIQIDSVAVL